MKALSLMLSNAPQSSKRTMSMTFRGAILHFAVIRRIVTPLFVSHLAYAIAPYALEDPSDSIINFGLPMAPSGVSALVNSMSLTDKKNKGHM